MANLPQITLKPGKDEALRRRHPWVFSGAIKSITCKLNEGDSVEVFSYDGRYLATGHFAKGSIAVRIFSFTQIIPDYRFWERKIFDAYVLRKRLGMVDNIETNAYRLVHAEGDGMPGLIIDIYGDTAVIQAHSLGMHRIRHEISTALQKIYDGRLKAVYDKSSAALPESLKLNFQDGYLFGKPGINEISEYGNRFYINWEEGQKTGFFIDQRENRKLLGQYSMNKKVLNTFCYSGGFSVYALKSGAALVHSVDSSKKAIEWAVKNIEMNGFSPDIHTCYTQETTEFLKTAEEKYDVIILDPPAYAKRLDAKHYAVQGYKRLNLLAFQNIRSGGILFTFSCSQVIDRKLFTDTIIAAAIESGRNIRILHHLSQPADHPVNIYHPEGEYLKGLVLFVD
ncbi:MAG: class I SAM-dependent rRNA methyltransferase [Bacteroidia bacterium]|nr:class I SAM-dependent rRNA methyltransferase [Bacteroidia bacterium]